MLDKLMNLTMRIADMTEKGLTSYHSLYYSRKHTEYPQSNQIFVQIA